MAESSDMPGRVSRRHFLKGIAAVAAPALLVACGGAAPATPGAANTEAPAPTSAPAAAATTPPEPTSAPAAAEAVKIVFGSWANVFDQAKEDFNKSNSAVQVEVAISPYDGYGEKLLTQIAAGSAPDAFWVQGGLFPGMVRRNVFLAIDSLLQDADVAGLDADPKVWASYDGKIYGLPAHVPVSFGVVYNKRLFKEAGATEPKYIDWSLDDLEAAATAITKAPDQWGTTVPNGFQLAGLILSNGGSFLNEDQTQCVLNSPEAREVFAYPVRWLEKKISPSATEVKALAQAGALFASDKFGMDAGVTLDWGTFSSMTREEALDADLVMPPIMPDGKRVAVGITHQVSMPNNGKNAEAAATFVKWLSFNDTALKDLLASIPVNYNMAKLAQELPNEKQREIMTKPLEYVSTLVPDPWGIYGAEGTRIFAEETEHMYLGSKTIEAATDDMVKRVNEVIAEQA